MHTVKAEPLSVEAFLPFGFYANFINPYAEKLGAAPIEFFRDMLQQDLGGRSLASFSTCRVEQRPLIVEVTECHSTQAEGQMPLDADVLVHVAAATAGDELSSRAIRVFAVPRGTMIVLRPGVWHHAPFVVDAAPANVLITLSERTYANDCTVVSFDEVDRIGIEA
jgi:ureidoglycolate lyase